MSVQSAEFRVQSKFRVQEDGVTESCKGQSEFHSAAALFALHCKLSTLHLL